MNVQAILIEAMQKSMLMIAFLVFMAAKNK